MNSEKRGIGWTATAALLALAIIAVGAVIALRLSASGSAEVEITRSPRPAIEGRIYVGGGVNDPGYYPLRSGDTLDDILAAAGGLASGASLDDVRLTLEPASDNTSQKVDINRADAWLLEALPGVGETRAQAIIAYREAHGLFRDIHELTMVPGFGEATFESLEDLITVAGPLAP